MEYYRNIKLEPDQTVEEEEEFGSGRNSCRR